MNSNRQDLKAARQRLVQSRGGLAATIKSWAKQPQSQSAMARMVVTFEEYLTDELVYHQKLEAVIDDLEQRLPPP